MLGWLSACRCCSCRCPSPLCRRRFLYVNIDAGMASQLVTLRVVQRLQEEYGGLYSADNVMITATHTHAGAGGYLEHFLYHITSLGFVDETFNAMVDGIVEVGPLRSAHLNSSSSSWCDCCCCCMQPCALHTVLQAMLPQAAGCPHLLPCCRRAMRPAAACSRQS